MPSFDVDNSKVVTLTNELERLHKSAFPVAVRETLNSAAFHMKGAKGKTGTIKNKAQKEFTERDRRFFSIISKVDKAQGFDTKKMASVVGFDDSRLRGQNNHAVENLEKQEHGGTIKGRDFVPLRQARTSKNWRKKVRKRSRLSEITNVVDAADNPRGKSDAQKFMLSALAAGQGNYVLGNNVNSDGNRFLFRINGVNKRDGSLKVNSTPEYAYKQNRRISISSKKFVHAAYQETAGKLPEFYKKQAHRRFEKEKMRGL